jgi:hypothetical protein
VCLPRRSAGGLSPADKRSTVQGLPEQKGQPKMRLLYGRVHNDVRLDNVMASRRFPSSERGHAANRF